MKKSYKILILLITVSLLSGCYGDKGSYNYSKWSGIASIEPLVLPGDGNIFEGDRLVITPQITFEKGFSQSDYTYRWIIGTTEVANTLNLSWIAQEVEGLTLNEGPIYLEMKSSKSGESWKIFPNNSANPIPIKIYYADSPLIGAIVYQSGNEVDWATIKGTKSEIAARDFSKLEFRTGLARKYNGSGVAGTYAAATFPRTSRPFQHDMIIYTTEGGSIIRTYEDKNKEPYIPLGHFTGDVIGTIFASSPAANGKPFNGANYFYDVLQGMLLGTDFYISQAASDYPYITYDPSADLPVQQNVAQVAYPSPINRPEGSFALLRYTNGEVKMVKIPTSAGAFFVSAAPLKEGTGTEIRNIILDEIVGVFAQAPITNTYTTMNIFIVGRTGGDYKIYRYTVSSALSVAGTNATWVESVNINSWGGGMTDGTQWYSSTCGSSGLISNPAFMVKGNKIYRFNHAALVVAPAVVAQFPDPIVLALPCTKVYGDATAANAIYTAVFTSRTTPQGEISSCYFIDSLTGEILKSYPDAIPGRVVNYLPIVD